MKFHAKTQDEMYLIQGDNSLKGKSVGANFSVKNHPWSEERNYKICV